jgi:C4-dicarboxylate transporter DctQ subunit
MHQKTGWIDQIEETVIAVLLGLMTLITFANVVARYLFNSNILWALELTVYLFGWLVLLGASYAVKKNAHLGVDAIVTLLSHRARRVLALVAVSVCLVFALLLVKGSYDYWAPFADLPPTSGRWVPTGLNESARSMSFYEATDIPMVGLFSFLEGWINYGESYEKLPKVIPYIVLPIASLLLLLRFAQAALAIWRGELEQVVASHEIDELDNDSAEARR